MNLRNIYYPIFFLIISTFFTGGFMEFVGDYESGCARDYTYLFGTEVDNWIYFSLSFSVWFFTYGVLTIMVFFAEEVEE